MTWRPQDPKATTYNPFATQPDDSKCTYALHGCTDSTAANFQPEATADDGSCITKVSGCMVAAASNFDSAATVSDSPSCRIPLHGCTDSHALNYAPSYSVEATEPCGQVRLRGCSNSFLHFKPGHTLLPAWL